MSREQYERGTILEHLMANRGIQVPMAFFQLLRGLRLLNLPLSPRDLRDRLEYLAAKGYVEVRRLQDMPGFRERDLKGDQQPDHIVTVKLTPAGVDLLEGAASDPGVAVV